MKKIFVPAAPFKKYTEIIELAAKCGSKIDRIQIDVCDGQFVESTSWPFTDYAKPDFVKLGEKADFDVSLPRWEDIDYSVDLMVKNPEKYLKTFVAYGIDEIIVHYRSVESDEQWLEIFQLAKQYDLCLIIGLDVKTDMDSLKIFLKENIENLSGVQVMGIEKIGFQGQDFATKSLDLVRDIRAEFPDIKIYFDGGINDNTIYEIAESGVDVFCVGTYLTKALDLSDNLSNLKNILRD